MKAPSAESTHAPGNSRGLFRRVLATRGAFSGSKGSGAPSFRRTPFALVVALAVIASLAVTAAPASAATPPTVTMGTVSEVSYASAKVRGVVNAGPDGFVAYRFEYSTDETNWTPAPSAEGLVVAASTDEPVEKELAGLKGGVKYFVRLYAFSSFDLSVNAASAPPNPSFTTLAVDPPTIVATDDASEVFSTSAKASGKVKRPANENAAFDVTGCRFEYVTDADFIATGFASASKAPCAEVSPEAPITEQNEEKVVTAKLGCANPLLPDPEGRCLKPTTTYHLRLAAENAAPAAATKEAANTFTTLPAVAKPVVLAADDATGVGKRTAKVTGEIERPAGEDPALDTSCRFEYVTDEQFIATGFAGAGVTPCVEASPEASPTNPAPGYPAVSAAVSAELSGLTPDTTYHLRLAAENGGGTETKVAAGTFTTLPIVPASVAVASITEVGYQKARVNAVADPGNQGLFYEVEYALAGTEEWFESYLGQGGFGVIFAGAPPQQFFKDFGPFGYSIIGPQGGKYLQLGPGLKPGTTYKVRGGWRDFDDIDSYRHSSEPYLEFTTKGTTTPPSVTLNSVETITATTAHFTATVSPNAPAGPLDDEGKATYKTDWHFECTPGCKDANGNAISGTVEAEGGAQPIAGDAKRLDPNTHYEVKLVVENGTGADESVQTFNTPLVKPTVKAAEGASDGEGGYTLQGVVNPNNSPVSDCKFEWGPNSADYAFTADCSPPPGDKAQPVTVEAHLAGLNPGVVYHYNLLVTNGAGQAESGDQEFVPTLDQAQSCPNEQIRKENNSLALPECRAYEKVTPDGKEGYKADFEEFYGGDRVAYGSGAGNIARSGQNIPLIKNKYVASRSNVGWETIPNLNGSSGTFRDAPSYVGNRIGFVAYSEDLLMSMWRLNRVGDPPGINFYLRNPDGTFTFAGSPDGAAESKRFTSADLSHLVLWTHPAGGALDWGPGVYEFAGTGNDQPRRVDVDNSASPITTCTIALQGASASGFGRSISSDGRVITFMVAGGCGGTNPPTNEIWARVNGTTSFDVSASQCDRAATDPGGLCNGPVGSGACAVNADGGETGPGCRGARFEGSTEDGSRIFFSTNQQLLNADVDQTRDIYACDIPSGNPAPGPEKANQCAGLRQISGAQTGAAVEDVLAISVNGATVAFTASGVLAANEDALGEEAVAGDHNLYVWRTDAAHPDGQTMFVGRAYADKCPGPDMNDPTLVDCPPPVQTTPDGGYLVLNTASQLLNTDTDTARDIYRYDVETRDLSRVSTNVLGIAGNGDGFDVSISNENAVSNDGQKIVFITTEALSPADGNGEPDLYLWTSDRVSLISTGAVGHGVTASAGVSAVITASGQDIYFTTPGALTPTDGDDVGDVYDARIGGGFSFAHTAPCSGAGGACQSHGPAPALAPAPATTQPPADPGNVKPKTCPKGKVAKGNKCVKKKKHKKHSGKKYHGKKAAHKRGGGK